MERGIFGTEPDDGELLESEAGGPHRLVRDALALSPLPSPSLPMPPCLASDKMILGKDLIQHPAQRGGFCNGQGQSLCIHRHVHAGPNNSDPTL